MKTGFDHKACKQPRTFDIYLISMMAALGLFAGYGILTVAQVV